MACLSSQHLILHFHLDTCAALHPETCGKNMATRHETNATKLSAGFQGPFRPLFTMAQTARLYCKIPHLWCFALGRKKERSKITQQRKLTSVCWLYFSARYIFVQVHDCVMQKLTFCVSKPWQEPCSFCCTDYVWEKIHVCQIMTYPDWGVWTTYHMEKKTTPTLTVQTIIKHSFTKNHFNTLYTIFFPDWHCTSGCLQQNLFCIFWVLLN